MTADSNPFLIPIREFVGSRQATLFQTLKQPQFSGQLILTSTKKENWTFYLYLGRIVYATGGIHPVRRWKRNLNIYAPHLASKLASLEPHLQKELDFQECWEYELLNFWREKQEITRKQLIQIIRAIIIEILFDLNQTMEITFQLKASQSLTSQLVLLDTDQVIVEAWQLWQHWQGAKLADRSPNSAPIIKQAEQLSQRTSANTYQLMNKLFNGKSTLRDLSVQLKQDLVQMTRLMIPYLQLDLIEFIKIPDLPLPLSKLIPSQETPAPAPTTATGKALIICIDDNFPITEQMKQIVTRNGYNFLSFNNPYLAMALMSVNKPDFVFLDLDMPKVNVYEICTQLQQLFSFKLSSFQHIPIVIMSENLGLMDRVRAKMVGCSDFLSKPLNERAVLDLIAKYLKK
jgi:chemotaxis family two-component system response regulator PixG